MLALRNHGIMIGAVTVVAAILSGLYLAHKRPPAEQTVTLDDSACDILFNTHRPQGPIQHLLLARSDVLNKALEGPLRKAGLLTPAYPTPASIFRAARMSNIASPIHVTATHASAVAASESLQVWMRTYRTLAIRYQANCMLSRIEKRGRKDKLAASIFEKRALISIIENEGPVTGKVLREQKLQQLAGDVLELEAEWVLLHAEMDALREISSPDAIPANMSQSRIAIVPSVPDKLRERLATEQRDLFGVPAPTRVIETRPAVVVVAAAAAFMVSLLAVLPKQRRRSDESCAP
jgi:hypothetical protein